MYDFTGYPCNCIENLHTNLPPFAIEPDNTPTAFNILGKLSVASPSTRAEHLLVFMTLINITLALISCPEEAFSNGNFQQIF